MLFAHEGEEPAYPGAVPPLRATPHAIPSWRLGEGIVSEARWAGTRDYAPTVALKTALEYLAAWRSEDGLTVPEFNRAGYLEAAAQLREAWGVEDVGGRDAALDASGASMGMVRLPPQLDLTFDQPGMPEDPDNPGVRRRLRERYGIEASVGGFGEDGGFLRLSHACYTTDDDIKRIEEAICEMAGL